MKTFNHISFLAVCGIVLICPSCNSSDLSCDEDVNDWAKSHISYYSDSERDRIVGLPLSRQIAIYNGFSSEKKAELWRSKFQILIDSEETSAAEKEELREILKEIKPSLFSDLDNNQGILSNIEFKANNYFGGNKQRYNAYFCTWMTFEEYVRSSDADIPIFTKYEGEIGDNKLKCTCRHDVGCISQGGGVCNDNLSCEQKAKGCGFLGAYSCDGLCD